MTYFIIGDIHGEFIKLEQLLIKIGFYKNLHGTYEHPSAKAIFVGDLIDRGSHQLEVLYLVKNMVENGSAYLVMGNHELNAIGYATENTSNKGHYLRPHLEKNKHQHQAFLNEVSSDKRDYDAWIEWFKSLPLFLECAEFNVIHAFWETNLIDQLRPFLNPDNSLKEIHWQDAFTKSHPLFEILEKLLKGVEISLPDGVFYLDKDGHKRENTRIKWWELPNKNLADIALVDDEVRSQLENITTHSLQDLNLGDKPIFIGHYWMKDIPLLLSNQVVCVDYSAVLPKGKLVAYEYKSPELDNGNFIYV